MSAARRRMEAPDDPRPSTDVVGIAVHGALSWTHCSLSIPPGPFAHAEQGTSGT